MRSSNPGWLAHEHAESCFEKNVNQSLEQPPYSQHYNQALAVTLLTCCWSHNSIALLFSTTQHHREYGAQRGRSELVRRLTLQTWRLQWHCGANCMTADEKPYSLILSSRKQRRWARETATTTWAPFQLMAISRQGRKGAERWEISEEDGPSRYCKTIKMISSSQLCNCLSMRCQK